MDGVSVWREFGNAAGYKIEMVYYAGLKQLGLGFPKGF